MARCIRTRDGHCVGGLPPVQDVDVGQRLGNLRGIREAGRIFALPTYLFAVSVVAMVIAGVARELTGGLHHVHTGPGTVGIGSHSGLIAFGAIYIMARAFANGGFSLTGIEAVSNAVSALRPPEGRNARQILAMQGSIVAFLIAGISWLAHVTHATPYTAGFPTVLAQEAGVVFGHTPAGQVMFYFLQAGTAAILFTGGNTSFTGFPFLASFVRLHGMVGIGGDGRPAMINPACESLP